MTIESILQDFEKRIKEDQPINATEFIDASFKLNALKGSLDNEAIEAEMAFNRKKAQYIEADMANATAETLSKASEEYKTYKTYKAMAERVEEFIRLSKHRARINEF